MTKTSAPEARPVARTGGDWIEQDRCPACHGNRSDLGPLFSQRFHFGAGAAFTPPHQVRLAACVTCGLVSKTLVASPALLERMTIATSSELWVYDYDYAEELALVRGYDPATLNDVIDIGAAGGSFLNALPADARKSALDIVRFPTLRVSGEFVEGFLDDPALDWSRQPYRLASLFDVAEHLYDPTQAFTNLRQFCRRDGLVLIETGDTDAIASGRLPGWYYLNLLEHHIAWNRRSIEAILERTGFELLSFKRKIHKAPYRNSWRYNLKLLGYQVAPRTLQRLYGIAGKILDVPGNPMRVDHLQVLAIAR